MRATRDWLRRLGSFDCTLEAIPVIGRTGMEIFTTETPSAGRMWYNGDAGRDPGAALPRAWGVPESYVARCFVALGYADGPYPVPKPRRAGRIKIVEGDCGNAAWAGNDVEEVRS